MQTTKPFGLLAELTYSCPLHCPYCSNPLDLSAYRDDLTLAEWERVLVEARDLGVVQLHLSGGEPLQRRDLNEIVAKAHTLGLYTNLITSALALTRSRAERLREVGLDHVQISLQAADPALSDRIAGTPSWARKIAAARVVKELGFPLTLNVVLHRHNIDGVAAILELAHDLAADRVELANAQYYGWALHNRAALLPTRAQVERAEEVVRAARERWKERPSIIYVVPDYYGHYPKRCMGGWGHQQLTIAPNGAVLPCPAAGQIKDLPAENVRHRSLAWIWDESIMFNRFRGTEWMPEPCRSCPRRTVDLGGCRCQAFQLTGDAARTDPVCHLAPDHSIIDSAVRAANHDGVSGNAYPFAYRGFNAESIASSTSLSDGGRAMEGA